MRPRIDNVDFAVDEHIWGHRLYDEQLPHLSVLEFLTVLRSNTAAPLQVAGGSTPRYQPQRQIRLRALLFNNPFVESIRERPLSDVEKWSAWADRFKKDARDLETQSTATCAKSLASLSILPEPLNSYVPPPSRRAATNAGVRSSSSHLVQTRFTKTFG